MSAYIHDLQPRSNRRVVLALPHSPLAALATIQLRQRGWTVWPAATGDHARRLAATHFPAAVVLAADTKNESGWLTCAKLMLGQPRLRVLMVGELTAESSDLANYVGAESLLPEDIDAGDLIAEIEGVAVAA
ncbi:MAG: hypothetical protein U0746_14475 [Gemmataceae bacterium]